MHKKLIFILIGLWILSFVIFTQVWIKTQAPKHVDAHLNKSGFCIEQNRYLTDEEFILSAISWQISKWRMAEKNPETGKYSLVGLGDKVRRYRNETASRDFHGYAKSLGFDSNRDLYASKAREYYLADPQCCKVHGRFVTRTLHGGINLDSAYSKGELGRGVYVSYFQERYDSEGEITLRDPRKIIQGMTLTNCGQVFREGYQ